HWDVHYVLAGPQSRHRDSLMFSRLRISVLILALGISAAWATNTLYPYTGTGTTGMRVTQDPGNTNQALGNQIICDAVGTNCATVEAASTSPALADLPLVVAQSPTPAPVCTSVIAVNQTTSTDLKTFT